MSNFSLRPFQVRSLEALLRGQHVICIAPTGSGKSLIYERIAAKPGCRTLLVTPLRALARQQVGRLKALGIRVRENGTPQRELAGATTAASAWVVSPERLFSGRRGDVPSHLSALFSDWQPNFLVVDEAHCLWDWGESFRREFSEVRFLLDWPTIQRSVWLTATLSGEDRKELLQWMPGKQVFQEGEFSLNEGLRFQVERRAFSARGQSLIDYVKQKKDRNSHGIIFVQVREMAERLEHLLRSAGLRYAAYHAGRLHEEKLSIETQLNDGNLDGVVATSAFGMGVDCPRVDWVVVYQVPPSLTALAQAIGRTARGDRSGDAVLWWDSEDFGLIRWQARTPRRVRELLNMYRFCHESIRDRIDARTLLMHSFNRAFDDRIWVQDGSCESDFSGPKRV